MKKDRWVEKADALALVERLGVCTTSEFARALGRAGYRIAPDNRAYNILSRLARQSLVERVRGTQAVAYRIARRLIEREQYAVSWRITRRGVGRRKWLEANR